MSTPNESWAGQVPRPWTSAVSGHQLTTQTACDGPRVLEANGMSLEVSSGHLLEACDTAGCQVDEYFWTMYCSAPGRDPTRKRARMQPGRPPRPRHHAAPAERRPSRASASILVKCVSAKFTDPFLKSHARQFPGGGKGLRGPYCSSFEQQQQFEQ